MRPCCFVLGNGMEIVVISCSRHELLWHPVVSFNQVILYSRHEFFWHPAVLSWNNGIKVVMIRAYPFTCSYASSYSSYYSVSDSFNPVSLCTCHGILWAVFIFCAYLVSISFMTSCHSISGPFIPLISCSSHDFLWPVFIPRWCWMFSSVLEYLHFAAFFLWLHNFQWRLLNQVNCCSSHEN